MRNVFVIGMDPFNLETMERLRESRRYAFHPLLTTSSVRRAESYDYDTLVREADRELRESDRAVHAVVSWWDFPATALTSAMAELWDLYGPPLPSVITLEHKYWSRLLQRLVAPDHVPSFTAFDPFSEQALENIRDAGLDYPFWVKPVKSVNAYLGFRIDGPDDFDHAIGVIRAEIGYYGDPFQQALSRVDERPHEIDWVGGSSCLAEGIIGGRQCTLEGYVAYGEVHIYGAVDTVRRGDSPTFRGYLYPSKLPPPILRRMEQIATDVIDASGLDHSCFNIEFFYDEDSSRIWLLEVNVRLSQSHCDLFAKVDGASNQRVMLDVAQGREPQMPRRHGEFSVAAKWFLRSTEDGVVRSAPSEDDIAAVRDRLPGTRVDIDAAAGMRLSELPVQESYSFELGRVFAGAADDAELEHRLCQVEEMLPFEIEPIGDRP